MLTPVMRMTFAPKSDRKELHTAAGGRCVNSITFIPCRAILEESILSLWELWRVRLNVFGLEVILGFIRSWEI